MYFGTEAAGMRRAAYYSSNFVKWSLLATFVGLFVGGISTLFGHLLLFVNSWSVGMVLDRNPGLVLSEFGRQ